jgi:Spy/CpxP family protein refolding chaperone
MTSKLVVGGLAATVLLLAGTTVMAQGAAAPAAKAAPPTKVASTSKGNIDQDIKLLRQNVRTEKSKLILNALNLTADQTSKFLPIYKDYEKELSKLNDLREANVREYAANYTSMTDNKADELVNQALSYYRKRSDLIAAYYDKIRAALGTGTAARFAQVEWTLDNLIDLQIQSNLPLIVTPTSG